MRLAKPRIRWSDYGWYMVIAVLALFWGSVCLGTDWLFPDLGPWFKHLFEYIFNIDNARG